MLTSEVVVLGHFTFLFNITDLDTFIFESSDEDAITSAQKKKDIRSGFCAVSDNAILNKAL